MQLVLIRHGIAEDRATFEGADDSLRPLTKQGRWKMERVATGLRREVRSLDILATSPLRRAAQTAAVVAEAFRDIAITTAPSFAPDTPLEAALEWVYRHRSRETIAVVGHEPHLGALATWLMTGEREPRLSFRKGGACLLEFAAPPRVGEAQLLWMLTPALLRRIGD
jgi:phosphohistidine phosphatase